MYAGERVEWIVRQMERDLALSRAERQAWLRRQSRTTSASPRTPVWRRALAALLSALRRSTPETRPAPRIPRLERRGSGCRPAARDPKRLRRPSVWAGHDCRGRWRGVRRERAL
jgi:hypothetical protein